MSRHLAAPSIAARLRLALDHHRRGETTQARLHYEAVLSLEPRHFDALHLLGVLAIQSGRPGEALGLIERALRLQPAHAAAHCNRGLALDALAQCEAAVSSYDHALALQADFAEAHYNRGNALHKLGRYAEAVSSHDRALLLRPNLAEAHFNRGNALLDLQRPSAALAAYERAIALKPDYAEAWGNRGLALKGLERWEEALESHARAIALRPRDAVAHSNRGNAYRELRRWDEALRDYERAIEIEPELAAAHFNRGLVLHQLGRLEEALAGYERAVALKPDYHEAHCNRGNVYMARNEPAAAIDSYDRAITLKRDYAEGYFNRAIARLLNGDFAGGWEDYEWRWRNLSGSVANERREFAQPLWLGNAPIAGKTILLHGEQGLGDSLQFCRYAESVAGLQARVLLEVPPALATLMRNLSGVAELIPKGKSLPPFDYHCPLMSLPLAFRTTAATIPHPEGYLRADPVLAARWRERWPRGATPRIGLAWSGNAKQKNDHKRSIALAELAPHLPPKYDYVCLQVDVREADRAALAGHPGIRDFGAELDFPNTAGLIDGLDLVLAVDSSIAHLSAALGKPTWILLPFNPDWRWLLERRDSPWYGSVQLYRQPAAGDWKTVLQQVARDLTRACHQNFFCLP